MKLSPSKKKKSIEKKYIFKLYNKEKKIFQNKTKNSLKRMKHFQKTKKRSFKGKNFQKRKFVSQLFKL